MLNINYKKLISRSDINYHKPVEDSKEGLAIGNGRMGTLVWTTPSKVKFQINRADLIPVNSDHKGKQYGITDFCCGCAQVELFVGGVPFKKNEKFLQKLHLYDGRVVIQTEGLYIETFVDAERDIMAIHVKDSRNISTDKYITLKMLRPQLIELNEYKAEHFFVADGNNVTAIQKFKDGRYETESAVNITAKSKTCNKQIDAMTYQIDLDRNVSDYVVFITATDSYKKHPDVMAKAIALSQKALEIGIDGLKAESECWWEKFWPKSFVYASSKDKIAEFMEKTRTYYIYLMAITSRGILPPKFNGALWTTDGDKRAWGSQYWVWNMELLYFGLLSANHMELADCYFDMMYNRLPNCEKAAKWWWNCDGIYMPETTAFDGPLQLQGELAKELQDITLRKKEAEFASEELRQVTLFDSVEKSYFEPGSENGYYYVSHILSCGSSIAIQFWWYYRLTGDKVFLREKVYPFLKGSIEFYRSYAKREKDGLFHIYPSNIQESYWGAKDGIIDISALKALIPIALNVSVELDLDHDLRVLWQDFLNNIPSYPMGNEPEAIELESSIGEDLWAGGRMGDVAGNCNSVQLWLMPVFPFENVTLSTKDSALLDLAKRTYMKLPHRQHLLEKRQISVWSRLPIIAARLGLKEELKWVCAAHFANSYSMCNGLDTSEGDQAQNCELLAANATAMQEALIQSVPVEPGKEEILHFYAAWPEEWDAAFKLNSRGGFIITSQKKAGEILFILVESNNGETLKMINPWKGKEVFIYKNNYYQTSSKDDVLRITNSIGDNILLTNRKVDSIDELLSNFELSYEDISGDVEVIMPNGEKVTRSIGKKR